MKFLHRYRVILRRHEPKASPLPATRWWWTSWTVFPDQHSVGVVPWPPTGTPEERAHWRFIGDGEGIHWPELDEDISIEGLLAGRQSGETQASLRRWLERRKAG